MLPIDPRRFAERVGSWVRDAGPDSDVVASCRVRLARNIQGYPFVSRLEEEAACTLAGELHRLLGGASLDGETIWVPMDEAPPILRLMLRERHLASRDLAPGDGRRAVPAGRAVAFGESETLSVMVNEEDHLRLQGIASGLDLDRAYDCVRELDRRLENEVPFAFSERLGYLTGCPTNVGTGLRASVMLHLPALGMVRHELEKVFTAAQRTGLAVRGMYGEGSRAAGDFYQISNQVTLGRTEVQLVTDLATLVPGIVAFERRVRDLLLKERSGPLQDRISAAYGRLRTQTSVDAEHALAQLSLVRLGECLELVPRGATAQLAEVAIQVQEGHQHALNELDLEAELLDRTQRDRLRAEYLRRRYAE